VAIWSMLMAKRIQASQMIIISGINIRKFALFGNFTRFCSFSVPERALGRSYNSATFFLKSA
jgi:hypothetical protein